MDPDSTSILSYILLLMVLIATNAFFAMSEIAIVSLNDTKIKKMAGAGNKRAALLVNLVSQPSQFLATIQVGVTLSGFLASAIAADTFADIIAKNVVIPSVSPSVIRGVALVLVTLILSYVTLVFGELVPKRIAMNNYEKISLSVSKPIYYLSVAMRPFVAFLSASTNTMLKLIGIDPNQQPEEITEEEIRMMIDVGEESGHINQTEKDMINSIFEFDDITVDEMMTHRTEIVAIETEATLEEVTNLALEHGYSRIPVYKSELDNIVGILYAKDLLGLKSEEERRSFMVTKIMRPSLYVPESTNGKTLLTQFKEKKIQMAVVVDEYGGTSGLVTMEDLLETIVGNIQDEYDNEEEDISEIGENVYILDGLAPVEDIFEFFELKIDDEDDFDTIGGYIVNQLGFIPDNASQPEFAVGNIKFTVLGMDERRVDKIKAERIPLSEEPAAEEDKK